ncbi:hypothetical protein F1880_003093 [Penicillium rolfsii]|nr:hypothetical protein F1880_003093 [Penicillium rolfsii]
MPPLIWVFSEALVPLELNVQQIRDFGPDQSVTVRRFPIALKQESSLPIEISHLQPVRVGTWGFNVPDLQSQKPSTAAPPKSSTVMVRDGPRWAPVVAHGSSYPGAGASQNHGQRVQPKLSLSRLASSCCYVNEYAGSADGATQTHHTCGIAGPTAEIRVGASNFGFVRTPACSFLVSSGLCVPLLGPILADP